MNESGGETQGDEAYRVQVRREGQLTVTQHFNGLLDIFSNDPEAVVDALNDYVRAKQNAGELTAGEYPPEAHGHPSEAQVVPSTKAAHRPNETPIISLQAVSKHYKVGKQPIEALREVSLDIYTGELVAIIGPSGSGKSTLLQLIGCLDTPSKGTVTIHGRNTSKLRDGALSLLRRSTIGFIFQSFYLQPFLRLGDNVAVPAMFARKKQQRINEETTALLEKVGLVDRRRHFPKELSGGQIQRAAIARALINQPKIILADEPTGNLDSENSAKIVELFKTIRDQLGTTVVIVTHNPEVAKAADRTIHLKDGALI